jgi:predicted PurR-regulated permease PerM
MIGNENGSNDVTRTTLAVLFIGILIAASIWILRPFLSSMIWAAMIVIATWPFLLWLQSRLGGSRGLAVAAMVALILVVVIVPFLLAAITIVEKSDDIALRVKALAAFRPSPPPEWVGNIPLIGKRIADAWQHLTEISRDVLAAELTPYARQAAAWFVTQAGSIALMVVQFILTVLISAILYVKGEKVVAGVRRFARRLAGQHGEDAAVLAAKAVRGVALGVVVTAVIQASIGGIGLAVTGVPAAAFLTAVLFMLCLAQVPVLLLIPVVVWLYWAHGIVWGTILLVFAVIALTIDNFVRPVLIRRGADLSLVLIIPGVIGGLIAFGIIGLFIGPVVLAVAYALLKAWVLRNGSPEATDGADCL